MTALLFADRDPLNADVEHREDRPYDESDPGHLVMPSGTLVASYDRAFLAAAGREVLALHIAEAAAAVLPPLPTDVEPFS